MVKNIYSEIISSINEGKKICMVSRIRQKKGYLGTDLHRELVSQSNADRIIQKSLLEGIPQYSNEMELPFIAEPFYPEQRLIVLGGGHIAIPLVEFAAKTGFVVTVVDDRLSFANAERFPFAKHVTCENFERAIDNLAIKESDYVVIITRGHRYDSTCLKSICGGLEPCYVGMIGSRRRTAIVKEMLELEGCHSDRLNRVHTPIGLSIGAITPEEIAISILAELIAHKRLGATDSKQRDSSDMDYDVLEVLADEVNRPKAIITVISTKGSVPRGAGAKMIVYQEGNIRGSIGGGCSEAAVIQTARQIIGTNTYEVVDIDLTGDLAEDEGMVCGGIMTVLIEDYNPNLLL